MSDTEQQSIADLIGYTADVVSAFVSNNAVQSNDLPGLIGEVHAALSRAASGAGTAAAEPAHPKASPSEVRRSVTPDFLVSFEDGKRYKTLRRHLSGRGLTPEQYREKWGLPADYPMASPNYSKQRAELAKAAGLGRKGGRRPAAKDAATAETVKAKAPRGKKAAAAG